MLIDVDLQGSEELLQNRLRIIYGACIRVVKQGRRYYGSPQLQRKSITL